MAAIEITPARPEYKVTRRAALARTAALAAVTLPPAAGLVALDVPSPAQLRVQAQEEVAMLRNSVDQHIGWFAAWKDVRAEIATYEEIDEDVPEHLYLRSSDLEKLISETPPTSQEALVIISTIMLHGLSVMHNDPKWYSPEETAGATLARYLLETTPPDVLRRAGVEAAA